MAILLKRLWADDEGAIISVEMILIIGILLFGIIPGFVAMRNSINASFGTIGNILVRLVPSFTYSGWAFVGTPGGGSTIALVQGFEQDGNQSTELAAVQVVPIILGPSVTIPPAP
jgi:Flp pilus assembly pilin Flp